MAARFEQFRGEVKAAMGELGPEVPAADRPQVEAYLSQLQASARQAARALGDPSATTVPATVAVDQPEQLATFFPQRLPRFVVGDAVPGLPSWRLVEPLGAGGFGEVWKAENPHGVERVSTFKFFLDAAARKRFTAIEAENLATIHRDAPTAGVVRLLGAEPGQDPPWLQFEYVAGGDLSSLADAWQKLPDAERVKRSLGVVRSLAKTVGHFHALGVVHRDLKPSNILLRPNPPAPFPGKEGGAGFSPSPPGGGVGVGSSDHQLVVADFGISKILPAGQGAVPTPTNSANQTIRAYTALYASPQQKKFLPADKRDDIFALGVLWYQLLRGDLTLERPGGEGWKKALAKLGVSDAAIHLLGRCWDDEPDERPTDGAELAALLDDLYLPLAEPIEPNPQKKPTVVAAHAVAKAQRKPGEEISFPLPHGLMMAFCWVPTGSAQLGSPKREQDAVSEQLGRRQKWLKFESEAHRGVFTTKGFWLGKYPVTQEEWHALMGDCPSHFQAGNGGAEKVKGLDTTRFPVENVSWDMCQEFLKKMNSLGGMEWVFGYPARFILPHENQWEYACRGGLGNQSAFYWGSDLNGTQANMDGTFPFGTVTKGPSKDLPTPVGNYAAQFPHPWGLCDLHGNVWEWCDNQYEQSSDRVMRGGSMGDVGRHCRAANRNWDVADRVNQNYGVRILLPGPLWSHAPA